MSNSTDKDRSFYVNLYIDVLPTEDPEEIAKRTLDYFLDGTPIYSYGTITFGDHYMCKHLQLCWIDSKKDLFTTSEYEDFLKTIHAVQQYSNSFAICCKGLFVYDKKTGKLLAFSPITSFPLLKIRSTITTCLI